MIAEDGNLVSKVWAADELVLLPGKRFEVLVQGGRVGTYELRTLFYNQGKQGDQYPPRRLATLTVQGPAQPAVALPTRLVPFVDLRSVPMPSAASLSSLRTMRLTSSLSTLSSSIWIGSISGCSLALLKSG